MATKIIDLKIQTNQATIKELRDNLVAVNEELKKTSDSKSMEKLSKESDKLNKELADLTNTTERLAKVNGTVNASYADMYGEIQPLSGRLGELEDRMYELQFAGQQNTEEFRNIQSEAVKMRQTIILVDQGVDDLANNRGIATFGTGLKEVGASLLTLDFDRASKQAQGLAASAGKINFKQATDSVKSLGSTFLNLGKALLTNPLFLLAAAIGVIVGIIVKLMDKLGILKIIADGVGKVFEAFGDILDFVAEKIAIVTDAIGLTNVAQQKSADEFAASAKKKADAQEKSSNKITDSLDFEIALIKASGDESNEAFEKILAAEKEKRKQLLLTAKARAEEAIAAFQASVIKGDLDEKELADLKAKAEEQIRIYKNTIKANKVADVQADTDRRKRTEASNKTASDTAKQNAEKAAAKQKEYDQNRLNASRQIEDIKTSLIEDDVKRELETNRVKYERLIADTEANEKLLEEEKSKLIAQFGLQKKQEEDKINQATADREAEAQKKVVDAQNNAILTRFNTEAEALQLLADSAQENFEKELENEKGFNKEKEAELKKALTDSYKLSVGIRDEQEKQDLANLESNYKKEFDAAKGNEELQKALTLQYNAEKKGIEASFRNQDLIAFKEYNDAIIQIEEDSAAKEKKILEDKKAEYKKAFDDIAEAFQSALGESESLAGTLANDIVGNFEGIRSSVSELADTIKNIDFSNPDWGKQLSQAVAGAVNAVGGLISQVLSSIQAENQAKLDEELAGIEEQTQAESDVLNSQLENQLITREEYDKAKENLDKQAQAKELKARKEAFEVDKKNKIAQAWVAGIQGAVSAFAGAMQLGPIAGPIVGGVLAAAVLGLTGANVSKIKKQQFNGGGGGGGSASPSLGGSSSSSSPTANLFGNSSNLNNVSEPDAKENTVVVQNNIEISAVEMTKKQNMIKDTDNTGTLNLNQ